MAKLINKDKCEFINGSIIKKNEQIGISTIVWMQLNKLEVIMQQYMYLKGQPAYCAGPSLEGFERKTILDNGMPYIKAPDTPVTDKRVAEAMQFMAEADAINDAEKINSLIDDYAELIRWCNADKFIEGDCYKLIDTPELGDPLMLNGDDIVKCLTVLVKNPIEMED